MKTSTGILLILSSAALAGLALALTSKRTPGARLLASGIAFTLPWAAHAALASKSECSVLVLFDTHGPAPANAGLVQTMLRETGISAVVHVGDVFDSADLASPWFDVPFRDAVARWPFYVASGNHDVADPSTSEAFFSRFPALPGKMRCGPAEFFFLPWDPDATDVSWLSRNVEASTASSKILVLHRGVWPVDGGNASLREALQSLLPQFQLVLAGHEHVWSDTVHEVGGSQLRQILGVSGPKAYRCPPGAAETMACREGERGFLRLDIFADRIEVEKRILPGGG